MRAQNVRGSSQGQLAQVEGELQADIWIGVKKATFHGKLRTRHADANTAAHVKPGSLTHLLQAAKEEGGAARGLDVPPPYRRANDSVWSKACEAILRIRRPQRAGSEAQRQRAAHLHGR